jgi:hypothetical protein
MAAANMKIALALLVLFAVSTMVQARSLQADVSISNCASYGACRVL